MSSRDMTHKKLEEIYDFIIEISKGNFDLQLDPKGSEGLEPLVLLLNVMNEELNTLIHHIHSAKSNPYPTLYSLIIKKNLDIGFISQFTLNELNYQQKEAENISRLISPKSLKKLKRTLRIISTGKKTATRMSIDFKNSKGLLIKTSAEISVLKKEQEAEWFLINAIKITYRNEQLEKYRNNSTLLRKDKYPTRNRSILLQQNREMIEKLKNHLLKNLDKPFPGMKELAIFSNASESKIKKGFKHYYGTSIYKYFNEKRFEKAHLLLTETEKPVSTIAIECGFISPSHFSRSFKEHFGYRPSDVQRQPE